MGCPFWRWWSWCPAGESNPCCDRPGCCLECVVGDYAPEVGVLVEVEAFAFGLDEGVGDGVDVVFVGVLSERFDDFALYCFVAGGVGVHCVFLFSVALCLTPITIHHRV